MKFNFIYNFVSRQKMTFQKYSILRILQIEKIKELEFSGDLLDVGSKPSTNNISNFIKNTKITYLNKFEPGTESNLSIDLEKKIVEESLNAKKYDTVLLMNVLEHIYNFQNCIDICYFQLKNNGKFYGSTPFYFRVHPSPNDYFRFTDEALKEILSKSGFKDIAIFPLVGGLFISFYSSFFLIGNKIPFLNNILLPVCFFLDDILSFFTKSYQKIMPIGYFFKAIK